MMKFLIGVGCGIGVGLLMAPQKGSETREQLARISSDPIGVAREKVGDLRQKISDAGARAGRQAAEAAVDKVIPESLATGTKPSRV
jgi:gas vesicle protein